MPRLTPLMVLLAACTPPSPPAPAADPLAPLAPDRLAADVAHLSDDAFRGREAGTEDTARAAGWLAGELAAAGLQPAPGAEALTWDYTLYRRGYDPDGTALALSVDGQDRPAALGRTWRPFPFSDPGAVEAEVVFAGYGITAPEHGWDDYAGLDVEGKIVLILRHEPGEDDPDSPFDGVSSSEHATFLRKARTAADHGALGYLLVTDPLHHEPADDLRVDGRLSLEPGDPPRGQSEGPAFRAAQIDRATAEALVASTGQDLAALQRAVDAGTPPAELALGPVTARLSVALRDEAAEIPERNVVAVVPGASRPDEWVVIGAHYDHIGAFDGPGDTVFNGADDNASGTAGLLALARAFAARPTPPARTLAFMAFSAEEKGLLGSQAWVRDHATDDIVFMLNLDMISRNPDRPVAAYGDGYATGASDRVQAAAEAAGLTVELGGDAYFGASDHDPFAKASVPFLFFFTGTHEDYHQLGDHADKVDAQHMSRIVRTAWHLLQPLADGTWTPEYVHHPGWMEASLAGTTVQDVDPEGRAGRGGLRTGDRVVAINGEPVEADALGAALRGIPPGSTAVFDVQRDGERVQVSVDRAKVGYLGVFPGALSEEQRATVRLPDEQGVLLRSVVEDGPAWKGGLREGDIVAQIGGEPVGPRTLGRILQRIGAGETVDVRIVREGQEQVLAVTLGSREERR